MASSILRLDFIRPLRTTVRFVQPLFVITDPSHPPAAHDLALERLAFLPLALELLYGAVLVRVRYFRDVDSLRTPLVWMLSFRFWI